MLEYAVKEGKTPGRVTDDRDGTALFTGDFLTERMKARTGLKFNPGDWRGYLLGIGTVVLSTVLGRLLSQVFSPANIIMLYLLCVTVTAVFCGLGPSILVSILSVLAFDFFLIPPYLTFVVDDTQYILTFLVLLFVGIVISYFMARIRQQTDAARQREREASTFFALGRNLTVAIGLEDIAKAVSLSARDVFGCDAVIFLPDGEHPGGVKPCPTGGSPSVGERETAAALWSFQHQMPSGRGTDVMPDVRTRYVPLKTSRGTIGVIGLQVSNAEHGPTARQSRVLGVFADLAAMAIERVRFAEDAGNRQVLEASEKLQTALLNSISHDLRTPLVSVIGVLSGLQEKGMGLQDTDKGNLIQVAREEADRLNHLITNLLDVSRIEAGALRLNRQPSELSDIVAVTMDQLGERAGSHQISVAVSPDLPDVMVDFSLMVQVFINILDNAIKYSPAGSLVEVSARAVDTEVEITVADRGIGIPAQDLQKVFDKFYRVQRPEKVGGTGLGLSIARGIIEAHGGHIVAENRPGGGAIIQLTLPAWEVAPHEDAKDG